MVRTARSLIKVINELDPKLLMTVSARSKNIQTFIKAPLVYLEITCGIWSSISAISLKLGGQVIASDEPLDYLYLVAIFVITFGTSVAFYIQASNYAMKFYEQLEVMPI